eukprot:scaffold279589_cov22-Tisochrysis_lutea.AAC.1
MVLWGGGDGVRRRRRELARESVCCVSGWSIPPLPCGLRAVALCLVWSCVCEGAGAASVG